MKKVNHGEIKDAIFDFVYHEAMNDATLQKAYENDKSLIEGKEGAKKAVKNYIDGILSGEEKPTFDDTVAAVRADIEDTKFTFGNIQKLINMTVKYFYILCYNNEGLRENFKDCHCPMDRKMITAARKLLSNEIKRKDLKSDTSWSKLDCKAGEKPKEYEVFQNAISEKCKECDISPIEFDYLEWQNDNKNED